MRAGSNARPFSLRFDSDANGGVTAKPRDAEMSEHMIRRVVGHAFEYLKITERGAFWVGSEREATMCTADLAKLLVATHYMPHSHVHAYPKIEA